MGYYSLVRTAKFVSSEWPDLKLRRDKLSQKPSIFIINLIYIVLAKNALHVLYADLCGRETDLYQLNKLSEFVRLMSVSARVSKR